MRNKRDKEHKVGILDIHILEYTRYWSCCHGNKCTKHHTENNMNRHRTWGCKVRIIVEKYVEECMSKHSTQNCPQCKELRNIQIQIPKMFIATNYININNIHTCRYFVTTRGIEARRAYWSLYRMWTQLITFQMAANRLRFNFLPLEQKRKTRCTIMY